MGELGEKFHLSKGQLSHICKGVQVDPLTKSRGCGRLIPEVEAVIRARRAEVVDWMTVGDEIGWSTPTTIRFGALLGPPDQLNPPTDVPARDKQVLELRSQGVAFREISKQVRVSAETARRSA
jgi:hypothetical protein